MRKEGQHEQRQVRAGLACWRNHSNCVAKREQIREWQLMRLERKAERGWGPLHTMWTAFHFAHSVGDGESLKASRQGEPDLCSRQLALLQRG